MRIIVPALASILALAACQEPVSTANISAAPTSAAQHDEDEEFDVKVKVSGSGVVDLRAANGGLAEFAFEAKQRHSGKATGTFFQRRTRNGMLVDFEGEVICVTVDPAFPGRVRIGGIVTANRSTDPAFMTENHVVGAHVWFRVTDGEKSGGVDASTTYGFKPTLVNRSEEYCALPFDGLPWWNPASIFPLESGSIELKD